MKAIIAISRAMKTKPQMVFGSFVRPTAAISTAPSIPIMIISTMPWRLLKIISKKVGNPRERRFA